MKSIYRILALAAMAVTALASCSKDNGVNSGKLTVDGKTSNVRLEIVVYSNQYYGFAFVDNAIVTDDNGQPVSGKGAVLSLNGSPKVGTSTVQDLQGVVYKIFIPGDMNTNLNNQYRISELNMNFVPQEDGTVSVEATGKAVLGGQTDNPIVDLPVEVRSGASEGETISFSLKYSGTPKYFTAEPM